MKLAVALTLALAAVPARAGYSIRLQRAQGPGTTMQFRPKAAFVLQSRSDLNAMIGTLKLDGRPSPQYYSLLSAGESLLKKGAVTAVPVGQEVYFLTPDLKSGEVVSLKDDQSFDTPELSDTFKRLEKALKGMDRVTANLKDLAKLYDAAGDVLPEGYRGFTPVSLETGREILIRLKPNGRGRSSPLALFDAESKTVEVLPGSARSFPIKDVLLSPDKTALVSLKGDKLLARDLRTGRTQVAADKFKRAVVVSPNAVVFLKDGALYDYRLSDGRTRKVAGSLEGIEFSDISDDGRYAVGVRRGAGAVKVEVVDLRAKKVARQWWSGPVDVSFYRGGSEHIAVYGPNDLAPWLWAWKADR